MVDVRPQQTKTRTLSGCFLVKTHTLHAYFRSRMRRTQARILRVPDDLPELKRECTLLDCPADKTYYCPEYCGGRKRENTLLVCLLQKVRTGSFPDCSAAKACSFPEFLTWQMRINVHLGISAERMSLQQDASQRRRKGRQLPDHSKIVAQCLSSRDSDARPYPPLQQPH